MFGTDRRTTPPTGTFPAPHSGEAFAGFPTFDEDRAPGTHFEGFVYSVVVEEQFDGFPFTCGLVTPVHAAFFRGT